MTVPEAAASNRSLAARSWRRALELTAPISQHAEVTFPIVIEQAATWFGDALALLSDHQTLTYRELAARIEHYARWAVSRQLEPGDVVGLMMANCPEYLAIWLGITRVGGVAALLNTHLRGDALRHSIAIVAPRHLIVAPEFAAAIAGVASQCDIWVCGGDAGGRPRVDIGDFSLAVIDGPLPTLSDRALYIYTSGTTGLPKAASVSHYRIMQWTHWFAGLIDAQPDDRMYNCLPMYHSIGGVVAAGAVLVAGGSVAVRERFSASGFWDDVACWDCTLFQYIGELCRYLTAAPPHPRETSHRLRLACGNGLRSDVWQAFQDRFQIPRIIEYYAATEASFSLYNCEGKIGAIGRIPPFLAHRFPVALARFDRERGDVVRGDDGFCVRCAPDEAGEAIGRLAVDEVGLGGRFEGYTDGTASERKILRDVFIKGDAWYRTGDLMRKDRAGFYYFVDRIGDTFRWKGENVSTAEVEESILTHPKITDAVVYGVAVPGTDGRAGMAALVARPDFDISTLPDYLASRLPEYARPLFIRLCRQIDTTATFRPQKSALARQGFDPAAIDDPLYVYDRRQAAFTELDGARLAAIQRGEMRL
ncbi:MAG TPA: long-chain-acyl-CoA synthetase [Stellaceae bacterium]|nr:long-chain-acyl-CoA synthetase [Stellaceae bacterium]